MVCVSSSFFAIIYHPIRLKFFLVLQFARSQTITFFISSPTIFINMSNHAIFVVFYWYASNTIKIWFILCIAYVIPSTLSKMLLYLAPTTSLSSYFVSYKVNDCTRIPLTIPKNFFKLHDFLIINLITEFSLQTVSSKILNNCRLFDASLKA